ncbi:hypothetical protein BJF86_09795 [Serinicoccus sp. CNJ-927]|uniref:AraC family ligand binding domain-containing protein n=1 Tax=Serinicoccus sp. CNJ-927 TaxID=1904970 RepID=UPI00095D1655|nr:AraC family ligand binding domain-containing protein [Serinicoccus sp. CNJ-927]OLT38912.1 hypothetical protein BJF86_09795 [Serinicoccus sp. CNJ-927]
MEPAPDRVRAFRPGLRGVEEVFHAAWKDHAYPTHTHDTRTVLVVDRGAIGYALDRRAGQAPPRAGRTVLPPHVPHDGRALTEGGFAKRVLCLARTRSVLTC